MHSLNDATSRKPTIPSYHSVIAHSEFIIRLCGSGDMLSGATVGGVMLRYVGRARYLRSTKALIPCSQV